MSHSRGLLSLDRPGFEVLIRAGGTGEGEGGRGVQEGKASLIHQWPGVLPRCLTSLSVLI